MALVINAQFNRFVQFAQQQANPSTSEAIARVTGKEDILVGCTISASNTDHVRGVFNWRDRSDTDAAQNNETRAFFKKAVADIFGGEGKIPKAVRDAMRLKDYGTPERPLGKPLTARRIDAVRRAVERHFADYPQAFDRAKQSAAEVYGQFDHDAVDAAVSQALSAGITDSDAVDLVIGHMRLLIVRPNATLYPAEKIREKAEALLANVQELRTLAKGDRAVFNAGLAFLAKLEGKALPPGAFRNIFNSVKHLSVRALKNIGPGCGPVRLHKAFRAFVDMTQDAVDRSGAGVAQQLALYRLPLRTFVGHLIMARCGGKDVQSLHDALRGEDGKTLYLFYQDLATGVVEYEVEDPMDKVRMNIMVAESNQQYSRFDGLVTEALGSDMANYQGLDFEGEIEHDQDYVDEICGDFLSTIAKNPEAYEPNWG